MHTQTRTWSSAIPRVALALAILFGVMVVPAESAHAGVASNCLTNSESPCANVSISDIWGSVIVSGNTWSWYAGTVRVEMDVDHFSSSFWNDSRTCYSSTSCSYPTTAFDCDPGLYTATTTGTRAGPYYTVSATSTTWN